MRTGSSDSSGKKSNVRKLKWSKVEELNCRKSERISLKNAKEKTGIRKRRNNSSQGGYP